jgi:hypothetical protein
MSFMGDRRTSKFQLDHAKKLIKECLSFDPNMRDEVYLQICKQVTKHPKEQNMIEGLELMSLLKSLASIF